MEKIGGPKTHYCVDLKQKIGEMVESHGWVGKIAGDFDEYREITPVNPIGAK